MKNGEAIARRIREEYFKAVLRQDIAFFDTSGAGAITTRITTDTRTHLTSHCVLFPPEIPSLPPHRLDPDRYLRESGDSRPIRIVVHRRIRQ